MQQVLILAALNEIFLGIPPVLYVKLPGEFRKPFGKPLVVIAFPSHSMAPPLMGAFMTADEIRQIDLIPDAKFMLLCRIEEGEPTQIEQTGPALPVTPHNVSDRELLIRIRPKITLKNAEGIGRFRRDGYSQARRSEEADCSGGQMATPGSLSEIPDGVIESGLNRLHKIVRLVICKNFHLDIADLFAGDLVVAKRKAGCRQRNIAFPLGDQFLAISRFTYFISGCDQP